MDESVDARQFEQARVDYQLVGELRRLVADALSTERRMRASVGRPVMSRDDEEMFGLDRITQLLAQRRQNDTLQGRALPPPSEDERVIKATYAAVFGLGRLGELMELPGLAEIEIIGFDGVWLVMKDGRVVPGPPVADSDTELVEWVVSQATYSGLSSRPFNPNDPYLVMRLPDGSRLSAVSWICPRVTLKIRLYRQERVMLPDLRAGFNPDVELFLRKAVLGRLNIIISGATNSGKTTLLRALGNSVPWGEYLVTIEHFQELGFDEFPDLHRAVTALEERPANSEGQGAVSMEEMVVMSRRLNPGRLILGEAVSDEILALLDSFSQGSDGGMSTIHANSSRGVFEKIGLYAAMSKRQLPHSATNRLISEAVDLVVHMSMLRDDDGRVSRYITSIREVAGADDAQVHSNELFVFNWQTRQLEQRHNLAEDRQARMDEHHGAALRAMEES